VSRSAKQWAYWGIFMKNTQCWRVISCCGMCKKIKTRIGSKISNRKKLLCRSDGGQSRRKSAFICRLPRSPKKEAMLGRKLVIASTGFQLACLEWLSMLVKQEKMYLFEKATDHSTNQRGLQNLVERTFRSNGGGGGKKKKKKICSLGVGSIATWVGS